MGAKDRISILGCGWLGYPVAERLIQQKHEVLGSTTSPEKIKVLEKAGIKPYLIQCNPFIEGSDLSSFFDSNILILTLPFKRSFEDPRIYHDQIQSILECVNKSSIEKIIFSSSTSIYPPDCEEAIEDEVYELHNQRARVLWQIEQYLLSLPTSQATILRFSGLCGGSRKIGRFYTGRENVPGGDLPVNLVHLDDCVQIVERVVEEDFPGEIFNVSTDQHPTKKELYTKAALEGDFKAPVFNLEKIIGKKIVSNKKVKERLQYSFLYPNPLNFPL